MAKRAVRLSCGHWADDVRRVFSRTERVTWRKLNWVNWRGCQTWSADWRSSEEGVIERGDDRTVPETEGMPKRGGWEGCVVCWCEIKQRFETLLS